MARAERGLEARTRGIGQRTAVGIGGAHCLGFAMEGCASVAVAFEVGGGYDAGEAEGYGDALEPWSRCWRERKLQGSREGCKLF
jgi:hypothetical protein